MLLKITCRYLHKILILSIEHNERFRVCVMTVFVLCGVGGGKLELLNLEKSAKENTKPNARIRSRRPLKIALMLADVYESFRG
jgi:hypothetical protein